MRKPAFCICENKDADQRRGNREADQCLCFRYTDSTIPLLSKKYKPHAFLRSLTKTLADKNTRNLHTFSLDKNT